MKSRYNLRLSSNHRIDSSHAKKRFVRRLNSKIENKGSTRRHSLRLNASVKPQKTRSIIQNNVKPRKIENEPNEEEKTTTDVDNYDELLARHHRRMLEEQKDRKLYERYVRDQRTLRRLQCRRTHSAHLSDKTRTRLLRELERERRYTVQEQICTRLAKNVFLFRHKNQIHSSQTIDWNNLEEELIRTQNQETIRQLDEMINNLKKVTHPSKSNTSNKPRLSVHERQKQRLAASSNETSIVNNQTNDFQLNSNSNVFSRLQIVRFADEENLHSENQNNQLHLTCIQNVLSSNNRHSSRLSTNELSTVTTNRRSKTLSESSTSNKKRPIEKENCSLVTSPTANNIVLRASSPMISIKSSAATANSYRTSRKISNLTTRRQRRFS